MQVHISADLGISVRGCGHCGHRVAGTARPGRRRGRHRNGRIRANSRASTSALAADPGPEEKIALGEQALALERGVLDRPLQAARGRVKGELYFDLAHAYATRRQGDSAENLEKSIAHYEAALAAYRREEFPQEWALQHNLGVA